MARLNSALVGMILVLAPPMVPLRHFGYGASASKPHQLMFLSPFSNFLAALNSTRLQQRRLRQTMAHAHYAHHHRHCHRAAPPVLRGSEYEIRRVISQLEGRIMEVESAFEAKRQILDRYRTVPVPGAWGSMSLVSI